MLEITTDTKPSPHLHKLSKGTGENLGPDSTVEVGESRTPGGGMGLSEDKPGLRPTDRQTDRPTGMSRGKAERQSCKEQTLA